MDKNDFQSCYASLNHLRFGLKLATKENIYLNFKNFEDFYIYLRLELFGNLRLFWHNFEEIITKFVKLF